MKNKLSPKTFVTTQILILLIGLGLIFGLNNFVNKDNKSFDIKNLSPMTTQPASFNLEVFTPDDEIISFNKAILVSGKTLSGATVIISNNSLDWALEAAASGDFSKTVDLSTGLNKIIVTAFDSFGNTKSIRRMVYYSEEKI